jgi:hypothetical protein
MHRNLSAAKRAKKASYIELRSLALVLLTGILIVAAPLILRAIDANGDNLDDTWEAQYGITTNAYASTNLVGWWQMEGTNAANPVIDRSTNGVTGTPTNTVYGTGQFGNALYFSTNGSVAFPPTNSLNTTNGFTFSTWFKSTNSTPYPASVATWSDGTNAWMIGADTNGAPVLAFGNGSGEQVVEPSAGPTNLLDGNWHQLAGTYDTNQVATVYMDGTNVASATISGWTPGPVNSFTFGSTATNAPVNPFVLDEARLYNRALGATEIPQLPVTYYDLNGTGLSVYDDYLLGLNPVATNEIVTSGFLSSGLTAYYTGTPAITKTAGDRQVVAASAFAVTPLTVHVTDSLGNALIGAPVSFVIASGSDGGLALSSGGTAGISVSQTTDINGNASVYYQAGAESFQNNFITATATTNTGSVEVTFVAYCGMNTGLAMWFRADAGVTVTSGAVSALADQAGSYNLANPTSGNRPTFISSDINGMPGMHFAGSQCLYSSNSLGTSFNADMTIISVGMTTNAGGESSLYLGTEGTTGADRGLGYGANAEDFQTWRNTAFGFAAPGAGVFTVEAATLNSSLTGVTFYRNGAQVATATISGLQNATRWVTLGGAGGGGNWVGDLNESMVFSQQLTAAQIEQVSVYLADKYGLYNANATWPWQYSLAVQNEIARNHWSKSQADAYVAFQAANPGMMTNGLLTWLEASQGVTTSGGNVTSIVDQAEGAVFSQATTANQPTFVSSDINGQPGMRFSGNQLLTSALDIRQGMSSDITVITVGMTTSASNSAVGQFGFYLGTSGVSGQSRGFGYEYGKEYFDTCGTGCLGGSEPLPNQFVSEATMLNSSCTQATFYQDGVQTGTSSLSGVLFPSYTGAWVGANYVSIYLQNEWQGDIVEELVYDHALSPTEYQQVDTYLANKYGLYGPNATWISAYTSAVQTEIAKHRWNKSQADAYVAFQAANPNVMTTGLSLWYRADAGVSLSGTNVTAIADQTGNGPTLTQAHLVGYPTYVPNDVNGLPGLRFTSTQGLASASALQPGLNGDISIVIVGSIATEVLAPYTALYLGQGITNGANRAFEYTNGVETLDGLNVGATGGLIPGMNQSLIEIAELNPTLTNATIYQNGSATTGTVTGAFTNLSPGVSLGIIPGGSNWWIGDIQEVMVYDHQLTAAEQDFVELYLANKYGIWAPTLLPAPTFTPTGGSFASSQSVSIAQVPLTSIHYTLDGSTPTSNSPTYSGTLTLTQSCPLSAAYFVGANQVSPVASAQFYIGDSGNIGISDAWQTMYFGHTGINPTALAPSGLIYLQAYLYGYNPLLVSTNGDGLSDLLNHQLGYAGSNTDINGAVDSNGNPLTNAQQLQLGLDPFDPVTNPAAPGEPAGTPGDTTPPTITLTRPNNAVLTP